MKTLFLTLACAVLALWSPVARAKESHSKPLWAAVSAGNAVFAEDESYDLELSFAIVNDGKVAVDPHIRDSQVFINGRVLSSWPSLLGWRAADSKLLLPGQSAHLSTGMGDVFEQPGIYRVRWMSQTFEAPEITIRVLPRARVQNREPTAVTLTRLIRSQLPPGWKVHHTSSGMFLESIEVVLTQPILMAQPDVINGPAAAEPWKNKPEQFSFRLYVDPFVSPEDFRLKTARNAEIRQQMGLIEAQGGGLRKFDQYIPPTSTEAEKEQAARYYLLRDSLYHLPKFYFRDMSLSLSHSWIFGENYDVARITDGATRRECAGVMARVLSLFSRYQIEI